jgi:GxxExxY protein
MKKIAQTRLDAITDAVVDSAFAVHRALGPGLLESAYEACLAYEMTEKGLSVEAQKELPLYYKEVTLQSGFRIDLMVENTVLVELKAVEAIHPIHKAQILSYLKLSACSVGYLINFNVVYLKDGIQRFRL